MQEQASEKIRTEKLQRTLSNHAIDAESRFLVRCLGSDFTNYGGQNNTIPTQPSP
jgi:hypothetical protein